MIDLDRRNFDYDEEILTSALRQTLRKIKQALASYMPTVIWSGNGYHIYIPIEAAVLENIKEFSNVHEVSTGFVRFAERYLSNGKSDPAHNTNVSLHNCLLRIPGSINSNLSRRAIIIFR